MTTDNVPNWLTANFLKSTLESDECFKDITIVEFTPEPVVAAGNNYGSCLLRVKIKFKTQEKSTPQNLSVIIKSPVVEYIEEFKAISEGFYTIEPKFYNHFIHESKQLMNHNIVPKHYISPNPLCVVLEDLKDSGYKMGNRHEFLDWDHCQLYIEAATKLQALSVVTHKKNPELIEFLGKEFHEEKSKKVFDKMILGSFFCICEYLQDQPAYKKYLNILKGITENFTETIPRLLEELKSKPGLKTLNQGDPWCTNMMFQYDDEGKPISIKLIDFQSLSLSSPVRGFLSFLWLGVAPQVRETKLDDLCLLYCDSLNKNLMELGCSERLTFEELKKEIILWSPLTLIYTCSFIPLCISDEAVDMKDFISGSSDGVGIKERPIYKSYQGKHFNKHYPFILEQAAKLGAFDYMKEKLEQLS